MDKELDINQHSIAVIGFSGRFPEAEDTDQLWENLCQGVEAVKFYSYEELLANGVDPAVVDYPGYVRAGIELAGKDCFDANFFGISPKEAELTDPQQRLLLECSYHVFEQAGYVPQRQSRLNAGVFVGADPSSYFVHNLIFRPELMRQSDAVQMVYTNIGCATQISYHLNLSGPSLNVSTACSTSLVAVHQACRSLMLYECDMALAGGASIDARPQHGYLYQPDGVYSSDGHCRAFDDKADGTVPGQGVGIVLLKRYEDAVADGDNIYALIHGSAVNNDGSQKVNYTAPSIDGQIEVIHKALASAQLSPDQIDYIECHGTGTKLGDVIELTALSEVYGKGGSTEKKCLLGSIKTNIGHLNSAAGVAGLIKCILAVQKGVIPSSLNFETLNKKVDLSRMRLSINTDLKKWSKPNQPRIAAISSFGIGGTNAHLLLGEPPIIACKKNRDDVPVALLLSAKSINSLKVKIKHLLNYLLSNPKADLVNVAYTLSCARDMFENRAAFAVKDIEDAVSQLQSALTYKKLSRAKSKHDVTLLFASDRDKNVCNAYRELYENNEIFKECINECAQIIKQYMGFDVVQLLYPRPGDELQAIEKLSKNTYIQPVIFTFAYAVTRLWQSLGVKVDAVFGYSLGESMAACVAGVMSLEDALRFVCARTQYIDEIGPGTLVECFMKADAAGKYINSQCVIGALHSPDTLALSGPFNSMQRVISELERDNVVHIQSEVNHAFHSPMMEPVAKKIEPLLKSISFTRPSMDYFSSMSGEKVGDSDITSHQYWARQVTDRLNVSDAANAMLEDADRLFLEVGPPAASLKAIIKANALGRPVDMVASCGRNTVDNATGLSFLKAVACLWELGVGLDFKSLFSSYVNVRRLALPLYPFEKTSYWINAKKVTIANEQESIAEVGSTGISPKNDLQKEIMLVWCERLGLSSIGIQDDFFKLGGHSLIAVQIVSQIKQMFDIRIPLDEFLKNPTIEGMEEIMLNQQLKLVEECK